MIHVWDNLLGFIISCCSNVIQWFKNIHICWMKFSYDNFVSDLWQDGGFLRVVRFPPPIKLTATIELKYCWNWLSTLSHLLWDCMVVGFTTTWAITTKVVSSNLADDEVYSRQHYVIMFVSDLRQVSGFLWVIRFPPLIKLTTTI
jgi:hypothetical protein